MRYIFLIFPFWTLKTAISDFKFGFYVKFPTQNRLESSKIRNLDPKTSKSIFEPVFFNRIMGLQFHSSEGE